MHDGQHFLIMDLVVVLHIGGIAFEVEATRLRWEGEDGGRDDGLFQGVKSLLLGWAPGPLLGLAGECIEGASNIKKSWINFQ